MSYYEKETTFIEQFACDLLNKISINSKLNNLESKTAVDIITKDGYKIDVQFSKNFDRYGDYRLDIISAYDTQNSYVAPDYKYDIEISFKDNFEKKFNCKVNKTGKVFQKDYLDALIIFFYNGKSVMNNQTLSGILIIKKDKLLTFLETNKIDLFNKIKLNDKSRYNLNDIHGSAFIPIKVSDLVNETRCYFFRTIDEFIEQQDKVKAYLSN